METNRSTAAEDESARSIYNFLAKLSAADRRTACAVALDVIDAEIGVDNSIYRAVKVMHVVCLVHRAINRAIQEKQGVKEHMSCVC